jgi:4-aminobutyrate aminotransferase-like enzyme
MIFRKNLIHPAIKGIRGSGMMLAVEFGDSELMHRIVKNAVANGLVTDWFLFCDTAIRISPALNISKSEIEEACSRLLRSINQSL